MRDSARIDIMLAALGEYWRRVPDLRLSQIIVNATGKHAPAVFHTEDDVTLRGLQEAVTRTTEPPWTPPASALVARCPRCRGWIAFDANPGATLTIEAAYGNTIGIETPAPGVSFGPVCEQATKLASERTCTPAASAT